MADLGATHYRWRRDVRRVVNALEKQFPGVKCNTYYGHPWKGWDGRSIDVWDDEGRGHRINIITGQRVRDWLHALPWGPAIRHSLYRHSLWTSFGGYSYWTPSDHSGRLRHVHVTYW